MTTTTDRIANTVHAVAKTLASRRRAIAAAHADPRWNAEYRSKLIRETTDKARSELAALRADRDAAQQTESAALKRLRTVKADTNEAILAQLQGERAWRRTVRRLDTGADVLTVIQQAAKEGDRALLDVLAEEIGPYLESRKAPRQQIDGVMTLIGRAIDPLKTDAERQADTRQAALDKATYVADFALGHAEHELATGQPATVLPTADGGTVAVGQD